MGKKKRNQKQPKQNPKEKPLQKKPDFLRSIETHPDHILLRMRLKPNSKHCKCSIEEHEIELSIRQVPVEGKANKALISILSSLFKIAKGKIAITKGMLSRQKTLKLMIPNMEVEEVQFILDSY